MNTVNPLPPEIEAVLLTEAQIGERVRQLGCTIASDYAGEELTVVGVLRGAVVFLADLIRQLPGAVRIDTVAISSYGSASENTGVVRFLKDLDDDVSGKHVLVVEDIVDTGLSLKYLMENLASRQPRSLRVCAFLDKPERRQVSVHIDYTGFQIPNHFVVGYGLDFAQQFRHLPYLAVLKPCVYQS